MRNEDITGLINRLRSGYEVKVLTKWLKTLEAKAAELNIPIDITEGAFYSIVKPL
jgi:hypothetical protein